MTNISLRSVEFFYENPYKDIFKEANIEINTKWKTGVVGRNGMGKTTLLKIIDKQLVPYRGAVEIPVKTVYFPFEIKTKENDVLRVIKDSVAPFYEWEDKINDLLGKEDDESIRKYGELEEKYRESGGYDIDARINHEINLIGLDENILLRKYDTLSEGEKTKVMLISLFLNKDSFALIDEPTNHLDMKTREKIGKYLADKNGFICISHDRYLLDISCDHILSINKNDIRINHCSYSVWEENMKQEQEFELRKNEKLKKEINILEKTALEKRVWSDNKEKQKSKVNRSDKMQLANRGHIGHKAAKIMKKAKNTEKRIDRSLDEKRELLKNHFKEYEMKFFEGKKHHKKLLEVSDLSISYIDKKIIEKISFSVEQDDRVALIGKNGCGKTSIFKAITKEIESGGIIYFPNYISYKLAKQIPAWQEGVLEEKIKKSGYDVVNFRNILGSFGMKGEILKKEITNFSEGEKKKIELVKTILEPADIIFWDEPLNFLDIPTRIQLENAILKYKPTIIFIEHDRYFVDRIATKVIDLDKK